MRIVNKNLELFYIFYLAGTSLIVRHFYVPVYLAKETGNRKPQTNFFGQSGDFCSCLPEVLKYLKTLSELPRFSGSG